ncbi:MAG: iron-containing alcohol dehydrogenase [Trueperaceae bacterium]|nr:MAG: iron-containing alcohol dehydrogenase [Trueperaceae bacterium]
MHSWPVPKIEYGPLSLVEEERSVALLYSRQAWEALAGKLRISISWQAEVLDATEAHWLDLARDLRGEVVYAVGGGLAVDAAKYVASRQQLPLVSVPTALSVDAFLTWASGVRRAGCVTYLETKPPDLLWVDFEVLAEAPASIRAAGICDVLSIATGSWDWRFAEERNENLPSTRYLPYVDQVAQGILQGVLDCAEAAGHGDHDGLKQLLDCLVLEVQLCNAIGHSRPEEGSEHYFAYSVENIMGKGLPHGDLVGPGLILMAGLQGQDVGPLKRALKACHIPLTNIPQTVIDTTLKQLPAYAREHGLAFGLAHVLDQGTPGVLPRLD